MLKSSSHHRLINISLISWLLGNSSCFLAPFTAYPSFLSHYIFLSFIIFYCNIYYHTYTTDIVFSYNIRGDCYGKAELQILHSEKKKNAGQRLQKNRSADAAVRCNNRHVHVPSAQVLDNHAMRGTYRIRNPSYKKITLTS